MPTKRSKKGHAKEKEVRVWYKKVQREKNSMTGGEGVPLKVR